MKPIRKAAVIHDLCSIGRVALNNIMPVLSVMGIEACPVPTMLLSAHTGGYGTPEILSIESYLSRCADHFKREGIDFDAIFVGYLGTRRMIDETEHFLKDFSSSRLILDPIFGDHGKLYSNFNMNYVDKLRGLLKYGGVITPNYTEACLLAGVTFTESCDREKLMNIMDNLVELGAQAVVITSVPVDVSGQIGFAVWENSELYLFCDDKKGKDYPGTGDLFTAVLIGRLLTGHSLTEAAKGAHNFVSRCIEDSSQYDYPVREGVLFERNLRYLIEV